MMGWSLRRRLIEPPDKAVEAELEKKHGKLVWEVEVVTAENNVMEVHVDADTGAVVDVEEEKPEKETKREWKQEQKREHTSNSRTTEGGSERRAVLRGIPTEPG